MSGREGSGMGVRIKGICIQTIGATWQISRGSHREVKGVVQSEDRRTEAKRTPDDNVICDIMVSVADPKREILN